MKKMQDLTIHLNTMDYDSFYKELTQQSVKCWQHNADREQEFLKIGMQWIIYTASIEGLPKAGLCLCKDNDVTISVPNIVPIEAVQLTVQEYNAILHHFVKHILEPIRVNDNFTFELSKDELSLSDILDEKSVEKFTKFSRTANKSTGFSHPNDEQRWFDFILSSFNQDLDLDLLRDSLVDDGWSIDTSEELVMNYEYASSLLKYQQGQKV